jgi:glycosyltransferase involved in cell wall biosynthesis
LTGDSGPPDSELTRPGESTPRTIESVCLLTGEYPPAVGGIADYTACLAHALRDLGVRVSVITTPAPGRGAGDARTIRGWTWRSIGELSARLQAEPADVVHLQYQTAAYGMSPLVNVLPPVLRQCGVRTPFITTFHDLRPPYLFPKARLVRRLANHVLLGASDGAIFVNPANLARAHPRREAAWIPLAPSIRPGPNANRTEARRHLGLSGDDVALVFFGFVNASKGVDSLLRAVERLVRAGLQLRLLLVGEGHGASDPTNVATASAMRDLAASLNLEQQVTATGHLAAPELSSALAAGDLAVLPYTDGAALNRSSLLACLAHGLPVVTTTPQPLPEIPRRHRVPPFEDPDAFRLDTRVVASVPPEDDAALARTIYRLVDDPERRDALGRAAHAFVAPLRWDAVAQATLAFYRRVLNRGDRALTEFSGDYAGG